MKIKVRLFVKVIRRPHHCLRLTGLTPTDFWKLHKKLLPKWQKATQKQKSGRPYALLGLEEQLFCLLLYYRLYTTQVFLGHALRVDAATVCRTIKRLEPLLANVCELKKDRKVKKDEVEYIIFDCTEQSVQRPTKDQQVYYSGKKKQHTIKTEIGITNQGEILYVSPPTPGSKHDFALHKEHAPQTPQMADILRIGDSGYQGCQALYKHVLLPRKKQGKGPRKEEDILHNRAVAQKRIRVEHKLRRVKVFRILGDKHRNPLSTYGVKTSIVAGLVNMQAGF